MANNFEQAFSEFIDLNEYEQVENALFSVVRSAFKAGWSATGRDILEPGDVMESITRDLKNIEGADKSAG